MNKYYIIDKNLSAKAKGIMHILHCLPDDCEFSAKVIASMCKDCEDSINNGLKELENQGYLVRINRKLPNGRFAGCTYSFK